MKKIAAIVLMMGLMVGTAYAQQQAAPQGTAPQTGTMMHCPMMAGMQQGGNGKGMAHGGMMHCPMMKSMHSGHQPSQATPPAAPSKP